MRYFFNTTNGSFHTDLDGTVFENDYQARAGATIYAGEILRDNPDTVWDKNELVVTVTNDQGLILFTVMVLAQNAPATRPLER